MDSPTSKRRKIDIPITIEQNDELMSNNLDRAFARTQTFMREVSGAISISYQFLPGSEFSQPELIENEDEIADVWSVLCSKIFEQSQRIRQVMIHIMDESSLKCEMVETAFESRVYTLKLSNTKDEFDPRVLLENAYIWFVKYVKKALTRFAIKLYTVLCVEYVLRDETHMQYFGGKSKEINECTELRKWYGENVIGITLNKMSEFEARGSGWALLRISDMRININKNVGFHIGMSKNNLPLPSVIVHKRAVVNLFNTNEACFPWSVVAGLYPAKNNVNHLSSYPDYREVLNMDGIPIPMQMKYITKFENQNNISVNVFGVQYDENNWMCIGENESNKPFMLVPLYVSDKECERTVDLLMLQISGSENYHFCLIKDISRLLRSNLTRHKRRMYVCRRCLSYFHNEDKLNLHNLDCKRFPVAKSILPTDSQKFVSFTEFNFKEMVPFIIYADTECFLSPISSCLPNDNKPNSTLLHHHIPYSIAYYLHCSFNNDLSSFKIYRGNDCIDWFVKELFRIVENLAPYYFTVKPIVELTPEEKVSFLTSTECHICSKPFTNDDKKVRDHCHLTGKYRGCAHNSCNLNYQITKTLPVAFHNLTSYDGHFIIKEICERKEGEEVKNPGNIKLLAVNMERYKGFTKYVNYKRGQYIQLRFIDTFNFLSLSLEKCVSALSAESMAITRRYFNSDEQFSLASRKGVFPYEYVSSMDVLEETNLPSKSSFFSSLQNKDIKDEDYAFAQLVWEKFRCQTLGDYADLYLKIDTLLLADVFENFRINGIQTYGIDAAHFYTAPSMAWCAMKKITNVKIELLQDIDMLHFFEKSIRGGNVQCITRHAVANNKYLPTYDEKKPESYLMYFDVNNLYGFAMMQSLPMGSFRWVDNAAELDFMSVEDNAEIGYMLEVDLHYPDHLHDIHADYPLCPEKSNKLLATLYNKERYVLHYRVLKQCVQLGLKVIRIHRAVQFKQAAWLKSYIEVNTEKRKQSKNEWGRMFYKLMNNAIFGRSLMNVRKLRDVKWVTHWHGRHGAQSLIAKPNFKRRIIFDEQCMAIEMSKLSVFHNQPIYVGASILDLSKLKMNEFHYNVILAKAPSCPRLLYTDTDSLMYDFPFNIYEFIRNNSDHFDTENYDVNNPFGLERKNIGEIGLMKDENKGKIIEEFVGLRPKMYALKVYNKKDHVCKAKGVKKSVTEEMLIDEYRRCLYDSQEVNKVQVCIMSNSHLVFTVRQNKLALSSNDDKRFITDNKILTLPFGHYSLRETE